MRQKEKGCYWKRKSRQGPGDGRAQSAQNGPAKPQGNSIAACAFDPVPYGAGRQRETGYVTSEREGGREGELPR